MRTILCLVPSADDVLSKEILSRQRALEDCQVKVINLDEQLDYEQLLDALFDADSVQVW